MSLTLPTVSVTPGPNWATIINQALTVIDSHDHSSGKGAKVTPTGLLIDADLTINQNNLTSLRSTRFVAQSSALNTPLDLQCVYVVSGDLFYNNNAGVAVQITSGGTVNAPGAGAWKVKIPVSYPYAVIPGDAQRVIVVDTTAARTVNLPAATNEMFCIIKDRDGLSLTNNITVTPNGTDTIDGVNASFVIQENAAAYGFISDGVSAWYVV